MAIRVASLDELDIEENSIDMAIIDPPWKYDLLVGKEQRAANYPRMSSEDLTENFKKVYRLLKPGAHLYVWVTSAFIPQCLYIIYSSGFEYLQTLVWIKITKHGNLHFGLGNYYRNAAEFALLCCKPPKRRLKRRDLRNVWFAEAGEQTRKPITVETDWIKASTQENETVLYLFSGKKTFNIKRRFIFVDLVFNQEVELNRWIH